MTISGGGRRRKLGWIPGAAATNSRGASGEAAARRVESQEIIQGYTRPGRSKLRAPVQRQSIARGKDHGRASERSGRKFREGVAVFGVIIGVETCSNLFSRWPPVFAVSVVGFLF